MPIYEYLCSSCGCQFEEVQKFIDPPLEECPDCGKNSARRQVSMSAFHLKGGGWYKDGYSDKSTESKKTEKTLDSDKKIPPKDKQLSAEKSDSTSKKESSSSKESVSNKKEKAA